MLRTLCEKYTYLKDSDIEVLENIASVMNIFSELIKADLFIDCLTRDPNVAVVVAQSDYSKSVYNQSVVGEMAYRKNEPAALRTLELGVYSRDIKGITQENISVNQTVLPIKNDNNEVIGVLIMEKDVSRDVDTKRNMKILMETTELLTEALFQKDDIGFTEYINEAIIIFDAQGIVNYANRGASELYKRLGYQDDIMGMYFKNVAFNNYSLEQIIAEKFVSEHELNIGGLTLEVKYTVMKRKGNVSYVVMLIKDVTEVKEKEKELILKSVAISEIHHRVKNNLQTIASLLRLQSRRIEDPAVKKSFDESINRIHSIAVTHEILAQKGVDNIDIKEMLTRITENFKSYSQDAQTEIEFNVDGDEFTVDSDMATSIAMVVNEILQNSLEYAFVGKTRGCIEIRIQRGKIYSTVSITDDGVGFDVNEVRKGSLGISIVKSIIKDKLNGIFDMASSENGTKVVFDFKNE